MPSCGEPFSDGNSLLRLSCLRGGNADPGNSYSLVRADQAFSLVMEREDEYPTGIGEAVAIPHTNCLQISKPLVAVGTFPAGVDFAAADGLKASLLVLLLSPQGNSGGHLKMLARISRLARRGLAEELLACSDSLALIEKVELAEEDLLDM